MKRAPMRWNLARLLRGVAVALAIASMAACAESAPPNILFLVADDLSWHSVGYMGDPVVQTPNLDRLAADGVIFTHAAVTTSICMVSRTNLLTGRYLAALGGARVTAATWPQTWPARLRAAGYYGGHIGKIHVAGLSASGYDFWAGRNGYAWVTLPNGERVHSIEHDTNAALRFLRERPKGRPFFLQVAYTVPHAEDRDPRQYLPMPQEERLYMNAIVPAPATAAPEFWERMPPFFRDPLNESRRRWAIRFDTAAKYQEYVKNYYRLLSGLDRSVGTILDALRTSGEENNTVIVFTGDNGYFLGEHGLADKWYGYEETVRVPLFVRDPRLPANRHGQRNDDWALNIDLAPTFCELAGVPVPAVMQGHSLLPLIRGKTPPDWRSDFLHQFKWRSEAAIPASESVCSKDWKYTRWIVSGVEELFDLRRDPGETNNLAATPAYAAKLDELRRRRDVMRREIGGTPLEKLTDMPYGPGPAPGGGSGG